MYTGLVIEELLTLVERAEEHAHRSRRHLDSLALKPELLLRSGSKFPQENLLLAGVA
jgi:hypothetical protein